MAQMHRKEGFGEIPAEKESSKRNRRFAADGV